MIKKDFWTIRAHKIVDLEVSFEEAVTEDEAIEAVLSNDLTLIGDIIDESDINILKATISPLDGGINDIDGDDDEDDYE